MARKLDRSRVKHSALEIKDCGVCHTPHASDYPQQLRYPAGEICYSCHEEVRTRIRESAYVHDPVRRDECYACHESHASDYGNVLKKRFPENFYVPYSEGKYAVCFDCHSSGLAADRLTTDQTGFRNGDQNLHFLHVNREKGRSCRVCHEVHAGDQAMQIRREVLFGKAWLLPLTFVQKEDGGTCLPGCHRQKEYNRVIAIRY
jgi:predicted CXXCH cytochrome family protein